MFNNMIINIEKLSKLPDNERVIVIGLFDKLLDSVSGDNGTAMPGGQKINLIISELIYNTLVSHGYLIDKREFKIDSILKNN